MLVNQGQVNYNLLSRNNLSNTVEAGPDCYGNRDCTV